MAPAPSIQGVNSEELSCGSACQPISGPEPLSRGQSRFQEAMGLRARQSMLLRGRRHVMIRVTWMGRPAHGGRHSPCCHHCCAQDGRRWRLLTGSPVVHLAPGQTPALLRSARPCPATHDWLDQSHVLFTCKGMREEGKSPPCLEAKPQDAILVFYTYACIILGSKC